MILPGVHHRVGWRPIVPVMLYGPRRAMFCPGYLDSGADLTHMPVELAVALGIDLDACEPLAMELGGAKQKGLRSNKPVTVNIAGELALLSEPAIGDAASDSGLRDALLLGRDLFEFFKVSIDSRAGNVELEAYPETPGSWDARVEYRDAVLQVAGVPHEWDPERLVALAAEC